MSEELEVLFKTDAVLVRLMALQGNEIGQKHYHSYLDETVVCVEGQIELHVAGEQGYLLIPGQRGHVAPRLAHWVRNNEPVPAKYLLVQSGGSYDFLPMP